MTETSVRGEIAAKPVDQGRDYAWGTQLIYCKSNVAGVEALSCNIELLCMPNMRPRRSIIEVGMLGCHLVRGMENRLLLPWTTIGTKGTQALSMGRPRIGVSPSRSLTEQAR